jgi:hypothetical protein
MGHWTDAEGFHRITDDEAIELVDRKLGPPAAHLSPFLRQRLASEWQQWWKAELGHILSTAQRLGFADRFLTRCFARVYGDGEDPADADPNDWRHRLLMSEMAPAMFVHYLEGTGWSFGEWEPAPSKPGTDVDLCMIAPGGRATQLQVKAPDQPGRRANHTIIDGEYDERIVKKLRSAARQLPTAGDAVKIVAIHAQRVWGPADNPRGFDATLMGSSLGFQDGTVALPRNRLGLFALPEWQHIGAVMFLDLVRTDTTDYVCTVFLNPWATPRAEPGWFRDARVCYVDNNLVRWQGAAPRYGTLPDRTPIVDGEP